MVTNKRRGGYLATVEGVKKLKEAKRIKKYTYEKIREEAKVTLDQVKRLFNPQWGDGKYKIGEEAVEAICNVLDLKPEDIVTDWYAVEISSSDSEVPKFVVNIESNPDTSESKVLRIIKRVTRDKLEELELSGMGLTHVPREIFQLTSLTNLDLSNNDLSNLPREIFQLTSLTHLDLSNNDLSSLPREIFQLTSLTHLNLSNNDLSSLLPQIRQLTSLTHLDLSSNSLSSLRPQIFQLNNLTHLFLRSNSLKSLPPQIRQLTNLTHLFLSNNFLSDLPLEIGQLTNLTYLFLSNNDLSSLPLEIAQLTKLTELDLSNNDLSSLPPQIRKLTNLTELDLSFNNLSSLPPQIIQLTNLIELDLRENSLPPIPPEISKYFQEPANIINYYLSLQSNQTKPLHEAKMLLVGQGGVGKTSLRERLIRDKYDPRRNKTDGIDIENWTIEVDERELQVNIWDFGGQEIMHSTHQFFLTKRSLYVLVLDATLGEEENRIEYWLKIIQSFGKDSPVIIVGNKADQHPLDIDRRGLNNKYPQIKTFLETSCEKCEGIEELIEVIKKEINQLEHIDDQLPLTWFNIKQQLEGLDKDYIPYEQYESICETEGVTEEKNQHTLIQFLHDLGVVLNFKDDDRLQDTHVLNPEWVTNGVYKILNDYQLIVEARGILNRKILARILEHPKYPKIKHLFIVDMMRKFELCFDVEPDKQFLIPDILPKEEPYTGEWNNTLAFEYHYLVLPGSIISRFIVRMNNLIYEKNYWRSGVILENEGNKALVKADREDKKIIIRVKGPENTRRNLLTAIRSQFDYIHSTIPGIIPEEKVPLLDFPWIPPVDYQWLLNLERKGVEKTYVPGLTEEMNIKQLLNGIEELSKHIK